MFCVSWIKLSSWLVKVERLIVVVHRYGPILTKGSLLLSVMFGKDGVFWPNEVGAAVEAEDVTDKLLPRPVPSGD